jgi:glutaminase
MGRISSQIQSIMPVIVIWINSLNKYIILQRLAGGEHLGFNNSVFLSERESADRNYALGFFMREYKCYPDKTNLRECMDFYFQVRRMYRWA